MFETVSDEAYAPTADFQLSADAVGNQSAVAFTRLGDGGFVAAWSDSRYGNGSMRMQRFDLNGVKVGVEINLGAGFGAALAPTPTGGFLLIRTVEAPYPTSFEVKGQFYDSALNPVGTEFTVNARTDGFQIAESVTALAGGGYVVTWAQPEDQTFDHVRAQLLDAAGNKVGGEIIVTENAPGDKYEMGLTALAGGGFVAAWNGFEVVDQYGNLSPGLRGQIFDSAGNKIGPAFSLNTIVPGTQASSQLAALPSGGFVAAWSDDGGRQSGGQPNGNQGIWVQLFDSAGQKVGAAVHSPAGNMVANTPIILTTATGFLVTWREHESTTIGGPNELRAQRFDFSGNKVAEEFTLGGAAEALHVQMAGLALDSGAILLGWTHYPTSASNSDDVRAQLLFPIVHGTEVGDSFAGTASRDFFLGKGGDDIAAGAAGNDSLDGGDGNDRLDGGDGNDSLDGGHGDDRLAGGAGDDTALGGDGNDGILFGAALSAGDVVDGGEGSRDQLGLQGNYGTFGAGATPFTLAAGHLINIEMLVFLSGSDSRFGDTAGNAYSYNIATVDVNVAAGQQLTVSFNTLGVGENVTFNGSAETNGSFLTYGGLGIDILTGGQQSDAFYFGADGRFGSGDRVDGQGGSFDQLGLQGDYSGARAVSFAADSLTGIEMIVLLSAGDNRFGGGSGDGFSYDIVMNDANVADGARMFISANTLRADGTLTETLDFDGSAEKDGFFTVYAGSGADTIVGGERADELWGRGGADTIRGGLGADILRGGEGSDVFDYNDVAESTAAARDSILDFASGSDKIDLSGIDANSLADGDQAFTWVGTNAFSASGAASAGQLRVYEDGASWIVEGDTNGDGIADLVIQIPLGALAQGDFVP